MNRSVDNNAYSQILARERQRNLKSFEEFQRTALWLKSRGGLRGGDYKSFEMPRFGEFAKNHRMSLTTFFFLAVATPLIVQCSASQSDIKPRDILPLPLHGQEIPTKDGRFGAGLQVRSIERDFGIKVLDYLDDDPVLDDMCDRIEKNGTLGVLQSDDFLSSKGLPINVTPNPNGVGGALIEVRSTKGYHEWIQNQIKQGTLLPVEIKDAYIKNPDLTVKDLIDRDMNNALYEACHEKENGTPHPDLGKAPQDSGDLENWY